MVSGYSLYDSALAPLFVMINYQTFAAPHKMKLNLRGSYDVVTQEVTYDGVATPLIDILDDFIDAWEEDIPAATNFTTWDLYQRDIDPSATIPYAWLDTGGFTAGTNVGSQATNAAQQTTLTFKGAQGQIVRFTMFDARTNSSYAPAKFSLGSGTGLAAHVIDHRYICSEDGQTIKAPRYKTGSINRKLARVYGRLFPTS